MRIFLVILFSLFILVKIIDLYDDYRIKKKYGALNNLKIEEVETLPIEKRKPKHTVEVNLNGSEKIEKEINKKHINT